MQHDHRILVGWREWVSFPYLGIPAIKAKIDTGAFSSAIDTYFFETFRKEGRRKIRFGIHPMERSSRIEIICVADIIDRRQITDSGGHPEMRYVISTHLCMGGAIWPIELTLTDRTSLRYRLLLGRTALHNRVIIDPALSYQTGKTLERVLRKPGRKVTYSRREMFEILSDRSTSKPMPDE